MTESLKNPHFLIHLEKISISFISFASEVVASFSSTKVRNEPSVFLGEPGWQSSAGRPPEASESWQL